MGKYKNAKDILPQSLVEEIQKYIQGGHLYIPQTQRKAWGTKTGIREELKERNALIVNSFQLGATVTELALRFCLSEERIRGIIYGEE
ncbi:CD3324 family protein [Cohnella yongneupensis]|uniref:CD3324 family protein n=1 Tax=Cohnella yongneupensis TaxID=425006 RepID=A0ABW0QX56_9BACL